ncbi:MAG: helix-turn-helix domain-containing protein, partial [Hyphomicrobium sp.]
SSSRLPALVDLFYEWPLVTAPAAAKALRCSQQAVDRMLDDLGPSVQEMTGRSRYRMWTLAWGHGG